MSVSQLELRPIDGWSNYFAGSDGWIYSTKHCSVPQRLKGSLGKDGYRRVWLRRVIAGSKESHEFRIHQLVALCFLGPCPEGFQVCHGSGGRLDNTPQNLSYGTPKQNQLDRFRDGTDSRGEKHGKAILKETQVLEMRDLYANGMRICDIARKFFVEYHVVYCVVKRKNWKHVA